MINDNLLFFYFAEMIPPQERQRTPPDLRPKMATELRSEIFFALLTKEREFQCALKCKTLMMLPPPSTLDDTDRLQLSSTPVLDVSSNNF